MLMYGRSVDYIAESSDANIFYKIQVGWLAPGTSIANHLITSDQARATTTLTLQQC